MQEDNCLGHVIRASYSSFTGANQCGNWAAILYEGGYVV